MTNRISKKNRKNKHRISRKLFGGKPVFRNIVHFPNTSINTFDIALGIGQDMNGNIIYNNVNDWVLVSDTSRYAFFYRITFNNQQTSYINVNVDAQPNQITQVLELGVKFCIVTAVAEQEYEVEDIEKYTSTANEFRNECLVQYQVFSSSYENGNSITPALVHCQIQNNQGSLQLLRYLAQATQNRDENTYRSFLGLINYLTLNPNARLASAIMEFVPGSRNLNDVIDIARLPFSLAVNPLGPLLLTNMHRWILLRSALMSHYLHTDLHQGNVLYAYNPAIYFGFFHEVLPNGQLTGTNELIQLIDWGRTIRHQPLIDRITALFQHITNHIATNPTHFTSEFNNTRAVSQTIHVNRMRYDEFNNTIFEIFQDWLNIARLHHPLYNWLIDDDPEVCIDSHIIMLCENKYTLGNQLVNANTFASVVRAPDQAIVNAIAACI